MSLNKKQPKITIKDDEVVKAKKGDDYKWAEGAQLAEAVTLELPLKKK